MHGADCHEEKYDQIYGIRAKSSYRQVPCTESACCRNTEGMVHCIEKGHSGSPEAQKGRKGKGNIHGCDDPHDLGRLVSVSVFGKRGHFHVCKLQTVRAGGRDDKQQEDDDSESTDIMGRRPPEKKALRKGFNIIQDSRPCRSKTGNTFKPSVYKSKFAAIKHIRKHSENKGKDPRQYDCKETVLERKRLLSFDKDERKSSYKESYDEADEQRSECGITPVRYRYDKRQEHEKRADKQSLSDIDRYCLDIHYSALRSEIF